MLSAYLYHCADAIFAAFLSPIQPWKNPPTRAEIRIVEELYAMGEGAPPIRQQVLGARLGLDVADQLEEMGIYDASNMTQEDARELTSKATEQYEINELKNEKHLGLGTGSMEVSECPGSVTTQIEA